MSKRRRRRSTFPVMLAELTVAAWETAARRTWLMVSGSCSPAEYHRMMSEKAMALAESAGHRTMRAALAPWHRRATANARRLRKP